MTAIDGWSSQPLPPPAPASSAASRILRMSFRFSSSVSWSTGAG